MSVSTHQHHHEAQIWYSKQPPLQASFPHRVGGVLFTTMITHCPSCGMAVHPTMTRGYIQMDELDPIAISLSKCARCDTMASFVAILVDRGGRPDVLTLPYYPMPWEEPLSPGQVTKDKTLANLLL